MEITYTDLPVYAQKQRILDALENNQCLVVQSPTGSGKTTQLPVILNEAGFSKKGMIGVTQPRRIAALSVSEFIAKQLNTTFPGFVGYKMRFLDMTDTTTKIKIMTDGILLQEMKLDPWLSRYSAIIVDEAHERSLNIDFILGLLKRVLQERADFKVIISSATMNAEAFSVYFDDCPIVTIDTIIYPVTVIYDAPAISPIKSTITAEEALLDKIEASIQRILDNKQKGHVLCFLPGERIIKNCIMRLKQTPFSRHLELIPLYGRLSKEEQERVFIEPTGGKKKVVVATNIAETSITISNITAVIDSGLAKLNYYNPRTFTSSLNELLVSKASCNQRKGRAGRTGAGTCYRLYSRKDFEKRPLYTTEEIYRTDLCEVVLRMAELGITDFEEFDFIAPPGKEGLIGGIETLFLLNALEKDHSLSKIGKLMAEFPLMPRQSRMIVEAILNYPNVIDEVLIACSFLSARSPFLLPLGDEMQARKAHHAFRSKQGDFVSYLNLYYQYTAQQNKDQQKFCDKNYLDYKIMAEIVNIKTQLELIVNTLGIPLASGGTYQDYLTCIAAGMIQFICVKEKRDSYRSLTAERIQIHPGSTLFKTEPLFIVAGEIVRTSRMFAMSVSPITKEILNRLDDTIEARLLATTGRKNTPEKKVKKQQTQTLSQQQENIGESIRLGYKTYIIKKIKGKKHVVIPFDDLEKLAKTEKHDPRLAQAGKLRVTLVGGNYNLLTGEKLSFALHLAQNIDLSPIHEKIIKKSKAYSLREHPEKLIASLETILHTARYKPKRNELGFIGLTRDFSGYYRLTVFSNILKALNESIANLDTLIDECDDTLELSTEYKKIISTVYRKLSNLYE